MKSLAPLITIALCVGMYFMYIDPWTTEVKLLAAKKSEYTNVLDKAKELKTKRDAVLIDYNSIPEDQISRLNKIIPETFNSVLFANNVNNLASNNNLLIKEFKVNEPKNEDGSVVVIDTSTGFKTTLVNLKISGQYADFVRFLSSLEMGLNLVDVSKLSVTPVEDKKTGVISLEFELEAKTYSLR